MSLCECGCGREVTPAPRTRAERGWIKGEPRRFITGHNGGPPIEQRLAERVATEGECLLWQGAKTPDGYGKVWRDGKLVLAHRAAWELVHGPIPAHLELDHTCTERRCVKVAHLQLVTRAQHVRITRARTLSPAEEVS